MAHVPTAVCVSCEREMRPSKNGVRVKSIAASGPYYLIEADRWECDLCGREIIVGFAHRPFKQHFESGFENAHFDHQFVFRSERYPTTDEAKLHEAVKVLNRCRQRIERHIELAEKALKAHQEHPESSL